MDDEDANRIRIRNAIEADQIERLTRELADAKSEAVRLRSYNAGMDKIAANLERERDEARAAGWTPPGANGQPGKESK